MLTRTNWLVFLAGSTLGTAIASWGVQTHHPVQAIAIAYIVGSFPCVLRTAAQAGAELAHRRLALLHALDEEEAALARALKETSIP